MQQDISFNTPQGVFCLYRFPRRKRELLRAWDAADELLLDYLANEKLLNPDSHILIINDSFGALTTALSSFNITNWSDSYISQQAAKNNLHDNNCNTDRINFINSLESPRQGFNLVLIKTPKTLALLEDQLIKLKPAITSDTVIITGGMIKNLNRNIWQLLEKIIGPTSTSQARKKARLIFITPDNTIKPAENPCPTYYPLENSEHTICNHANVFSRDHLDIGTRFFMQHLPQDTLYKNIIDLGCGNGILGIMMQQHHPEAQLQFIDESHMAIASAKENYRSIIGNSTSAHFYTNDCLSNIPEKSADLILCNPPFHQHNTVSDHIAIRMFKQARRTLQKDGELWVIGNRHLKYQHSLKKIFSSYSVVASNPKFVIYKSIA